jgi:hypothetical protein
LYLRYGSYDAGVIVWQTAKEFNPVVLRRIYITKRISGEDLRDILYSHTKSNRTKSYELVLSANDLISESNFSYLIGFLNAEVCQFNLTNTDWASNAVTVVIQESDRLPFEYIDNHNLLRTIKFALIQKYPD